MIDKQVKASGFCETQGKEVSVYGNYVSDGFGGYALGTISCVHKNAGGKCDKTPCPLRSLFAKNI